MGILPHTITLKKSNGKEVPNVKAFIQSKTAFFSDKDLPIEVGDIIEHIRSPELIDEYEILDFSNLPIGPYSYQADIKRKSPHSSDKTEKPSTVYNFGNQSRVNINSEDNSINILNNPDFQKFEGLRKIITDNIHDENEKEMLIENVNELQECYGESSFKEKCSQFIDKLERHPVIIGVVSKLLINLGN